jgi:hypothetical protein
MNPAQNEAILGRAFLAEMYADTYFPPKLVDKGRAILLDLCAKIESRAPKGLPDLYDLTHRATDSFNDLQDEFVARKSKFNAVAKDSIAADMAFIAETYGYFEADAEELIAPREW